MEDSVILVDKPAGISSFGVVAKVRGYLKAKYGHKVKIGHTGTLDPFATGLLILLTGKMTKKSNDFLRHDKTYEATLKLGFTSTTGDPEGEIRKYLGEGVQGHLSEGAFRSAAARELAPAAHGARPLGRELPKANGPAGRGPERDVLEQILRSFLGEIEQTPPRFSAIKINGQRAYKLARAGEDFEIPKRKVIIYNIEILDYNYPELKIRTHVSSGTYIRTLAEDIGKALGTGAYLTALRRTEVGNFSVKNAEPLDNFTENHAII